MRTDWPKTIFIGICVIIAGGLISLSVKQAEETIETSIVNSANKISNNIRTNFDDIFRYGIETYIINNPSKGTRTGSDYGKINRDIEMKEARGIE